jgi:hypothetical protein
MKSVAEEQIPTLTVMRLDERWAGFISELGAMLPTDLLEKSRLCIIKSRHTN